MIVEKKHNCDNCYKADTCRFKDAAIAFEDKVNEDTDKPEVLTVLVHCNKFWGKRDSVTVKGIKEGTDKKLS